MPRRVPSYREVRKRLKKLPRYQRYEIGMAVMSGRRVRDREFADLASDYARVSQRTLVWSFVLNPVAVAIAMTSVALTDKDADVGFLIRGGLVLGALSLIVQFLVHRRMSARINRAETINKAFAESGVSEERMLAPAEADPTRIEIRGRGLAWVSWAFWVLLLFVVVIQDGLYGWILFPLSLVALAAWGLYYNPRKSLGWWTGVITFALGLGAVEDLTAPWTASSVITGAVSLCAALTALAAFVRSRPIRREWRRQEIELGADPPMLRRAWRWYRDRPVWAQVGLAILIIPPAVFIGSALLVGVFEGITEGS